MVMFQTRRCRCRKSFKLLMTFFERSRALQRIFDSLSARGHEITIGVPPTGAKQTHIEACKLARSTTPCLGNGTGLVTISIFELHDLLPFSLVLLLTRRSCRSFQHRKLTRDIRKFRS